MTSFRLTIAKYNLAFNVCIWFIFSICIDLPAFAQDSPSTTIIEPVISQDSFPLSDSLICNQFLEIDGFVVMEAENTSSAFGNWELREKVAGYTGNGHLEFLGNLPNGGKADSPLRYTFTIHKSGYYRLIIRAKKKLHNQSDFYSDDGYVRMIGEFGEGANTGNEHLDEAFLSLLNRDLKFTGGDDDRWGWAERLDLGQSNKRLAVYRFKAGKTYTLVLSGRSKYWNIDRIVLFHESHSLSEAKNLRLKETACQERINPQPGPSNPYAGSPVPFAHWTFENHAKDILGSLDGTIVGNPTFVSTAKEGNKAIKLDGDDKIVTQLFNPSSNGTITFWLNSTTYNFSRILGFNDNFEIRYWNGRIESDLFQGGNQVTQSPTTFFSGRWYHVACTWNYATKSANIYLNASLNVSTKFADDDPGAGVLSIGTRTDNQEFFKGILDDLRIYDVELTQQEIAAIHQMGTSTSSSAGTIYLDWVDENGLDEDENFDFSVYPNPAKSGLGIVSVSEKALLQLYDVNGRLIQEQIIEEQFSFQEVASGIYFIKVRTDSAVKTKKWIVQ